MSVIRRILVPPFDKIPPGPPFVKGGVWRFRQLLSGMCLVLFCLSVSILVSAQEGDKQETYHVAVLPFTAGDKALADMGADMPLLLSALLSGKPSLSLVERGDVDKALSEVELGLSGTVAPETAARVGHLTGAQVLVTGRVFPVQQELIIVAKIIGVETGRMYGETVTMPMTGSLEKAAQALAEKVANTIAHKGETLVARAAHHRDVVARLQPQVAGKTLPSVSISITERSIGRHDILDPAAETEIGHILLRLGFPIFDPTESNTRPDVVITGEAFSEFGMRKGNLVSSKARVEVRAVEKKTGKVLLIDREVTVAVDLSQEIAGKTALAKGAAKIAERLVPALMTLAQ